MPPWWRQLVPYLIALSLIGNLYLGAQFYQRDQHLNRVTWGNSVDELWMEINSASLAIGRDAATPLHSPTLHGAYQALERLEALRSLPHYRSRVDDDDVRTLQQFLRYAARAYDLAFNEQKEQGTMSQSSALRLERVKAGLEFALSHQSQTNQAKQSQNPWNHGEWRAMWSRLAAGLRETEFVPLPN